MDEGRKESPSFNRARVDDLCDQIEALPVLDDRSPDEILGYDEFGIPTSTRALSEGPANSACPAK